MPYGQGVVKKDKTDQEFYYSISVTTQGSVENNDNTEVKLPFAIDKPLSQMNKEELLMVIIKVIIYLLVQGKTII